MVDKFDKKTRSRIMASIRGKDTKPEILVRSLLHKKGLRFRKNVKSLPGSPDIVFPRFHAVIFIHGCFWHGHDCNILKWPQTRPEFWRKKIEGNRTNDYLSILALFAEGWRVCIIWECALKKGKNTNIENLIEKVIFWLNSKQTFMEIKSSKNNQKPNNFTTQGNKMLQINNIAKLLNEQNIKKHSGRTIFKFGDISFLVSSKDIVGSVIQEWLENWMNTNGIPFNKKSNSQEWPDFILQGNEYLEIKAFNYDASPGFDVANFDAYTRSLLDNPERLDSGYLIFGYRLEDNLLSIPDFWVKNVWEITGPSPTNHLSLQVKQGIPVNIRPKDWRGYGDVFRCRRDFVIALDKALNHFHPERYTLHYQNNWFSKVEQNYRQKTGNNL